jgi:hypothetical protein
VNLPTEYIQDIERRIAATRRDLEPLEDGTMTLGERRFGGEWVDITAQRIGHLKQKS